MLIRHQGILILKACAQDYNIDIKKQALQLLSQLTCFSQETQIEAKDSGVIDLCITQIDNYPDDEVDEEVLIDAIDLLSNTIGGCFQNSEYVINKKGLDKLIT